MAWQYNPAVRRTRDQRVLAEARERLGGVCVVCGTTENLQFDHIDPATKLFNVTMDVRRVGIERFWAEVAKCQLLCKPHHLEKSRGENSGEKSRGENSGENHGRAKLRELDVKYIRGLSALGHSQRAIAKEFGVSKYAVQAILSGKTWKHVQ